MSSDPETRARRYARLAGHEIRGSLHAIAQVLEEVIDDFADSIPMEVRDSLKAAHDRCSLVMDVVRSILAEPFHGAPRWIEIEALLEEVKDRLALHSDGREIELRLPAHSIRVWADPVGLREVFANLVANAVQHLDKPQGQIRIEHQRAADLHIFTVVDNGPGIPREKQPHFFQPFFRKESQRHRGSGLGLYFVRRIVEEHAGQAWVESVPGSGSRFSFSLPIEPTNVNAEDTPTRPADVCA